MPDGSTPKQCCFLDDMITRNHYTMHLYNGTDGSGGADIKVPAIFLGVNDGKDILAAAAAKLVSSLPCAATSAQC